MYVYINYGYCMYFSFLEFCEEGITYTAVKVQNSSNTQKRKITRISKSKGKKHLKLDFFFCLNNEL